MGAQEAGGGGSQTRGEAQVVPVWEQRMRKLGYNSMGGELHSPPGQGWPQEVLLSEKEWPFR